MTLPSGPHRRYNPLLDEWVLVSPQRLARPWQGRVDHPPSAERPAHDPTCYLCPRNARAAGATNPDYRGTFVFDNDYPALVNGTIEEHVEDDLLRAESETGTCRVVSFSPRHDLTLAQMTPTDVRRVIDTWADQTKQLGARDEISHVQIFENKGELMGCSNPHPHSQIWATHRIPTIPARKLHAFARYRQQHDTDLLGDYIAQELQEGVRVVFSTDHWAAVVPFWAVWPFEVMLVPLRAAKDLEALDLDEREGLAAAMRNLAEAYDKLFGCEFPYSMGIAQAPTDGRRHREWRLHLSFLPPLLRSASVRKYFVGYELTAEPQRDFTPEAAVERLRAVSDVAKA